MQRIRPREDDQPEFYTVGQRKGLGLVARKPLYVLDNRPATNTVVVGPHEALARTRVTARGRLHLPVERAQVKLRYRSPAVDASIEPTAQGFRLTLDTPAYGVARGQAAVLYDGDAVVGCGLVTTSGSA